MKQTHWIVAASLFASVAHAADKAPLFNIASDATPAAAVSQDIGTAKKTGETRAVKLKAQAAKKVDKPLFASTGQESATEKPAAAPAEKAPAEQTSDKAAANALQALAAQPQDTTQPTAQHSVPATAKKIALKAPEKKADSKTAKKADKPAAKPEKAEAESVKTVAQTETVNPEATPAAQMETVAATDTPLAADHATPDTPAKADSGESALFKIASYYEADEMGDSDDAVRKIDFSKPQGQQLPGDISPRRAIADSKAIQLAAANSSSKKTARKGSYSYVVHGKRYQTLASSDDFVQEGSASWYGPGFHGKKTASGEIYDMHKMTAAHKRLPLGTKLEVTHNRTGKTIIVTVNDRGPFHGNRIIDLSHAAASQLGVLKSGVADVTIRAIK